MAEFRQQGEHDVADLFEIAVTGLTLLMTGQLEEHDASFSALVERYRARGPADLSAMGTDVPRHW